MCQADERIALLPFADMLRTERAMRALSTLCTGLLWLKTLSFVKVLNQKFATYVHAHCSRPSRRLASRSFPSPPSRSIHPLRSQSLIPPVHRYVLCLFQIASDIRSFLVILLMVMLG